jgi:hypothetical protein
MKSIRCLVSLSLALVAPALARRSQSSQPAPEKPQLPKGQMPDLGRPWWRKDASGAK